MQLPKTKNNNPKRRKRREIRRRRARRLPIRKMTSDWTKLLAHPRKRRKEERLPTLAITLEKKRRRREKRQLKMAKLQRQRRKRKIKRRRAGLASKTTQRFAFSEIG